jgi:ligand-binding sensor domain-containing protein/DNA-binding CsgD family transcriptional regulator
MKIHHLLFLLILGILGFFTARAQHSPNLGTPSITNFTKQTYEAGTQNWDFTQDDSGVLYVANNEGLLSYDGTNWRVHPLPKKTIVRSVDFDPRNGRIYVGGQDEVGYFQKNEQGFFHYQTIKESIPPNFRTLADIWTIFHHRQGVYFISLNNLFYYNSTNDSVRVHPQAGQFIFLGKGKEKVVTQDLNGRVFLVNEAFDFRPMGQLDYEIVNISELGNDILIATEKNGLFIYSENNGIQPWKNESHDFLTENRVNRVFVLNNNLIALSTALNGLLIINEKGQALYWVDKPSGLQNNMIRSIFEDQDHNLWLGLDNGIDHLSISSPIRFFYPDGNLEGTSYDVAILNDQIYIGTSNGLYRSSWEPHYDPLQSRNPFEKIPGSDGQVWGLNTIGNQLFMGHHEGAFLVENNNLQKISPNSGYWTFTQDPIRPDQVLAGTYDGLHQFGQNKDGEWTYLQKVSDFTESSRFISVTTQGDFWVSHPYRGIFKVSIDQDSRKSSIQRYGSKDGLPSEGGNFVFRIWDDIVVCTEKGIFQYNPEADTFKPYEQLNEIVGAQVRVRRLFEDSQENLWYVTEDKVGYIEIVDKGLQKEVKTYKLQGLHAMLMGGFELIYPLDSVNVFFGSEKGMIHVNPQKIFSQDYHFKTLLSEIHLITDQDSLIFANQINQKEPERILLELPNMENSLRFSYTTTNFNPFHSISYQYMLEGFDEHWSNWSKNNIREYTNLPPGKYTFKVRSGFPDGYVSNTAYFSFYIQHPWYATPIAYSIYSFIFLLGIAGLVWIPRRKFEKEKALLEEEKEKKVAYHKAEMKQSQEALIEVKNEKLNAEIEHKNKELATTTMHLLQKSELIQKLRTELDRLRRIAEKPEARKELKRIIGLLNDDNQLDVEWEQFFLHFDRVHSDFFKRLKEKHPQLTAKDQKLCAYLRMNLSTKEIAPLMNISVRGVEISRYRLRKKLDLSSDVNLNEFMMEF